MRGGASENYEITKANSSKRETPTNWREDVLIRTVEDEVRKRVRNLLTRYEAMWSNRLGTIRSTKHRIELLKGGKPVYQQLYPAVHKARAIKIEEVDSMLRDGVKACIFRER